MPTLLLTHAKVPASLNQAIERVRDAHPTPAVFGAQCERNISPQITPVCLPSWYKIRPLTTTWDMPSALE